MDQATFEDKMKRVDWLAEQARWAAMTLPKRGICIVDDKTAVMDKVYFKELGEYSASLPTGVYIGKRWKKNTHNVPHWKCLACAKEFTGWGEEGQYCPDSPHCDGRLTHIAQPEDWWMGEYYDLGSETEVGIRWRKILVV